MSVIFSTMNCYVVKKEKMFQTLENWQWRSNSKIIFKFKFPNPALVTRLG